MKVWLDDEVSPHFSLCREENPKDWTWVKTARECIDLLNQHSHQVEAISFDYNLGEGTGLEVCKWIEKTITENYTGDENTSMDLPPYLRNMDVSFHTGSIEGAKKMQLCFKRIEAWIKNPYVNVVDSKGHVI
jgi:CheY-like chemotaxis protein